MATGLFAFCVVAALVLLCGGIFAVNIMRAGWTRREREALTSLDLSALEESAVLLVEQLKAEADRGIDEIERRCASLRELIEQADRKISVLSDLSDSVRPVRPQPQELSSALQVTTLAENGMHCSDIARSLGLTLGEVDLMLNLQRSSSGF